MTANDFQRDSQSAENALLQQFEFFNTIGTQQTLIL
jgi:hypothetical protein